jgi:hypothetical protein
MTKTVGSDLLIYKTNNAKFYRTEQQKIQCL